VTSEVFHLNKIKWAKISKKTGTRSGLMPWHASSSPLLCLSKGVVADTQVDEVVEGAVITEAEVAEATAAAVEDLQTNSSWAGGAVVLTSTPATNLSARRTVKTR